MDGWTYFWDGAGFEAEDSEGDDEDWCELSE
jgi:hypothetical protein